MTKITATVALLVALSSTVSAQEWTKEELESGVQRTQYKRQTLSGEKRTLENFGSLNTDCTPSEGYDVRVTQPPEHGTAEVVPVQRLFEYGKDNVRSRCNDRLSPGFALVYQSAEGYRGADQFDVLILLPSGRSREIHYSLTVR
jgi:hypothetical protein